MRPIIPNTKNDLRKIHDVLVELSKDVSEIKSALHVKSRIESPYWDPDNTSTSADAVNQWICSLCGGDTSAVEYDYIGSGTNHLSCELKQEIGSDEEG